MNGIAYLHAVTSPLPDPGKPVEYSFAEIARKLRLTQRSKRTQINQLRALADSEGLPLPTNPRFYRGRAQHGSLRIGANSRWQAGRFDAWLADWEGAGSPQPTRERTTRPGPQKVHSLHEEMARRAAKLGARP